MRSNCVGYQPICGSWVEATPRSSCTGFWKCLERLLSSNPYERTLDRTRAA